MNVKKRYDVVIVGGSYAGLSAALALGRSRRSVLIIDAGEPCNKPTPHSHNFLTQDGMVPHEIADLAKSQVLNYPTVDFRQGYVYDIMGEADSFEVTLDEGQTVVGRRLILATGIKDVLPDIAGFKACWGKTIVHCPYCHGYEYSDQKTGILASRDQAVEMVSLISNWTDDLTLFLTCEGCLDDEARSFIQSSNVKIVDQGISMIDHAEGKLNHLVMEDGSTESLAVMYARPDFEQQLPFLHVLGCELTESGHLEVDMFGATTVPGLFAVGDCASPFRSVSTAVYTGNVGGVKINHDLIEADR